MRDCAHWCSTRWKIWKWKDDLATFEWFWLNKLRRVTTYHGKLKSWKKCGWEILDNMAASITQHFLYLFIIAKWSSKYWAWPRHKPKPVQSVTMLRSNWPIIIIIIIIIITITITIIIIIIKIESNDWIQISLYLPNVDLASSPPTSPTAATVCFVWNCLHPSIIVIVIVIVVFDIIIIINTVFITTAPTVIAALCFVWNCLSLHIHIHQLHPPKQPHTHTSWSSYSLPIHHRHNNHRHHHQLLSPYPYPPIKSAKTSQDSVAQRQHWGMSSVLK